MKMCFHCSAHELEPTLLRRHLEEQITALVPSKIPGLRRVDRFLNNRLEEEFLQEKGWKLILRSKYAALKLCDVLHVNSLAKLLKNASLRLKVRDLVISLLRVKDYTLARELWIRLEEDETTFAEAAREFGEGPEADSQGVIGPIPIGLLQPPTLQDTLRGLKAGEMSPPIAVGEWQILLRLEKLTPTRLDDRVREEMLQEALTNFLDDRVRKICAGDGDALDPLHYDGE